MRTAHFRADHLDVGVRHNHARSEHFRTPQLRPNPFYVSHTHDASSPQWQALHIEVPNEYALSHGEPHVVNHDGLSPLLVPLYDTNYEDGLGRRANLLPDTTQSSSPRQRAGFPRGNPSITGPTPLSPVLSDSGLASPSLPVLSPHASERLKRSAIHRRKRTRLNPSAFINSQASWLALYFAFNLGLTLYNKLVLVRFPFPYTLTALHALCGSLGGYVLRYRGAYVPAPLSMKHYGALAAFSLLYAVNIAVSNVSLHLVTVPFHQVVRAATPIFTTALSMLLFGTHFNRLKILTLLPVMAGVALATYGDYYFTVWGLLLTLLGTFLAALKTIYTNVFQSTPPLSTPAPAGKDGLCSQIRAALPVPPRLALHPLDLLTRTSPLACALCVFYAYSSGELRHVSESFHSEGGASWARILVLLGNGVIAFGLNVVSLSANKRVGALNMTVAANVKQALTILCAVAIFHLTITPLNALGICVTLAGGAWYAWEEYVIKMKRKKEQGKRALTRNNAAALS